MNTNPNWQAVIGTLRANGWRQKAICSRVGLSAGTLSDLQAGRHREPKYTAGTALVSLYREVIGSEPPASTSGTGAT